jgi:hypothetical protein
MREGSLLIKVEDGKIVQLHIRPNLVYLYEKVFTDALHHIQETPEDVEKGVEVIVFGWLWLEASCNLWYMFLLYTEFGRMGKALWDATKRMNFFDKMSVIRANADEPKREEYDTLHNRLNSVCTLRNRLVHFKDIFQKVEIDDPVVLDAPEKVFEFFDAIPEPEVMRELTSPTLDEHADAIAKGVRWLESVFGIEFIAA